MIWRERRVLLIVLGLILAANVVFFLTYRVQYKSRLDAMDDRLAQVQSELDNAKQARASAEQSLQAYKRVEHDVQEVLDHHWSTQPKRFTLLVAEVKRLAAASNAGQPKSYSFSKGETSDNTPGFVVKNIGAKEVGIGFTVDATYDQARRMINLLELSQQFIIIDQIALAAGEQNRLTLNLHLKTLFRDEPVAGATNQL
jgi:hypothetical protein